MKEIIAHCSMGFANATHEDIIEVEDYATEEDIQMEVWEWAISFLETWYTEVGE